MQTYTVTGAVVGIKYLGEVQAETPEEAIEKAYEELPVHISLCHQCSDEIENAEIDFIVVADPDGNDFSDRSDEDKTQYIEQLRNALESVKAALGDRLLARGPLSKSYAHSVMREIDAALGLEHAPEAGRRRK